VLAKAKTGQKEIETQNTEEEDAILEALGFSVGLVFVLCEFKMSCFVKLLKWLCRREPGLCYWWKKFRVRA
jgi:hypothetical protein